MAGALAATACTGGATTPAPPLPELEFAFQALPPLEVAAEGTYEVWLVDADGAIVSAGRFSADGSGSGTGSVTVRSPLARPEYLMITIEPPGDRDAGPSPLKLLGGRFGVDGTAVLEVTGYVTPAGIPLEAAPGVHVLGTAPGRPGEPAPGDAGLWLADMRVDSTEAGFFQTFTPLTRGWTYEGWIVRDHGGDEVWLSYGQFVPNNLRKARYRDDTGIGPFSGLADYERALTGTVHYPGDDWIANSAGHPIPGGLALPLDLNGDAAVGAASRWTHVITIEPRPEPDGVRAEPPWEARPFFLRPYRNAIGEDDPATARTIGFVPAALPRGTARVRAAR